MDKQYRLRDVFSIPTVLFAFIGLTAMTVSFVGGLAFWVLAWLQTPVMRKKVAAKMSKEDFPFIQRTGFAVVAFMACMMVASGTQYSKPNQQAQAPTEQPPASEQVPPGEPVATATPAPPKQVKILDALDIIGKPVDVVDAKLGKPIKNGKGGPGMTYRDYKIGVYDIYIEFEGVEKASQIQIRKEGGLTGVTNESASILGAIGLSDSPPSKDSQYGADWYGKDGIGRITVHKSDVPYYIAVHLNRD